MNSIRRNVLGPLLLLGAVSANIDLPPMSVVTSDSLTVPPVVPVTPEAATVVPQTTVAPSMQPAVLNVPPVVPPLGATTSILSQAAVGILAVSSTVPIPTRPPVSTTTIVPLKDISQNAVDVVENMLKAFMHKMALRRTEKECLSRGAGEIMKNVMDVIRDAVISVRQVSGNESAAVNSVLPLMVDSGIGIRNVVRASKTMIEKCFDDEVVVTIQQAAEHLKNLTYVKRRLVVNGIDIAEYLAHAVIAWDKKEYSHFGEDIGTILRKIMLSKANDARKLPEGFPETRVMQEATQGFMHGFFVKGSTMTLTDQADPNTSIVVHLDQCISKSQPFFHDIWDAVWSLLGKMTTNAEEYDVHPEEEEGDTFASRPLNGLRFTSELAEAMTLLPSALVACGISQRSQEMLGEAITALNSTHIAFNMPGTQYTPRKVREQMAYAAFYWAQYDFKDFGIQLGALLRDAVVLSFPEKYAVDASGRLERTRGGQDRTWLAVPSLAVISFLGSLVGMRAIRGWRNARPSSSRGFLDLETCSDDEAVVE